MSSDSQTVSASYPKTRRNSNHTGVPQNTCQEKMMQLPHLQATQGKEASLGNRHTEEQILVPSPGHHGHNSSIVRALLALVFEFIA